MIFSLSCVRVTHGMDLGGPGGVIGYHPGSQSVCLDLLAAELSIGTTMMCRISEFKGRPALISNHRIDNPQRQEEQRAGKLGMRKIYVCGPDARTHKQNFWELIKTGE